MGYNTPHFYHILFVGDAYEEKENLFLEKKKRLATIMGIVVLVFLVCLTLVLLTIKFYILAETDSQENIFKQNQQSSQYTEQSNFINVVKGYNSTLAQIDSFYKKELYFNQALDILNRVPSPNGLYFTNFSLSRIENGNIKMDVSGVSATRDNLLIFKHNVEADKEIKNPYFSPESWISAQNTNFSLSLEISQNGKK